MPGHCGNGAVTRSTLRQQIADALRDEVLAGRLQPGQEFTVKEIAEQYGVSATPVREALVDLSAQGLLEADQHRGFRVHEYSVDDFRGMIEARGLVIDGHVPGARRGTRTAARPDDPRVRRRPRRGPPPRRGGPAGRRRRRPRPSSSATTCGSGASSAPASATPTSPTSCTGCACSPGCARCSTCAGSAICAASCGPATPSWSTRSSAATRRRPVDHRRVQRPLARTDRAARRGPGPAGMTTAEVSLSGVRWVWDHARREP